MSRVVIFVYGAGMGGLAVILNVIGLNLGWVYLFMGIVIGSAVYPLWCMMTDDRASAQGALTAAWVGQILAVGAWLLLAGVYMGGISVFNLGNNYVMLGGNLVALGSSFFIMQIQMITKPDNYDWKSMARARVGSLLGLTPSTRHAIELTRRQPHRARSSYWRTTAAGCPPKIWIPMN